MQAFDDVVVLDLTQHIAGPYATRLLADYGADVIKVEPPWGDVARRLAPLATRNASLPRPAGERGTRSGDEAASSSALRVLRSALEESGLFFYLNANKRSVVIDLREEAGREALRGLAERADIVVESFAPGTLERLGCGWEFFHQVKPSLSLVSITNFGQDGPYRDYKGSELVLFGFGGEMYSSGMTEREPVKMGGTAALFQAGSSASAAITGALFASRRHGIGQHVDIAIAEMFLGSPDRRHATATAFQYSGRRTMRAADQGNGMPAGVYQCADGYVDFSVAAVHFDRVVAMIAEDWTRDPRYADPMSRRKAEIIDEWNAQFIVWCLERTKREIWALARAAKVVAAPLYTMEDLFTDEHFHARGFWHTAHHPVLGDAEMPGRPFIMPEGGWSLRRPAPLLGEHTEEVLGNGGTALTRPFGPPSPAEAGEGLRHTGASATARLRAPDSRTEVPRPTRYLHGNTSLPPVGKGAEPRRAEGGLREAGEGRPPLPLAGIRVLDFCVVWAGPFATALLGDLGAEVIKVENPFVWQPLTRGGRARPPKEMLAAASAWGGGFPRGEPGPRPWNYSPNTVSFFRNKKSVTMDLRRPEGMETLRRLVVTSDIVFENNAPDTLERLGIAYDWLRAAREDIIYVRMPAFGLSGPYGAARAFGVHLEAVLGHSLLRGYEGTGPTANTTMYPADFFGGGVGAFAAMAALWQRERTGRGQLVEIAQIEAASAMFTQAIMDYSLNRHVQGAIGNRDVFGFTPCGVYPCLSPGTAETMEDRWVTIHVQGDDDWGGLKRAMGSPAWANDPRFATNDGRSAHHEEIDRRIAAWTATLDDYEVMRRCQAEGVASMPVLEASRMFDDPHLRARNFFRRQFIPDAGEHEYAGPQWRFSETPIEFRQPPVTFGEHNEYVYRDLLGTSEDEIARLTAAGHIATEYDASVP